MNDMSVGENSRPETWYSWFFDGFRQYSIYPAIKRGNGQAAI